MSLTDVPPTQTANEAAAIPVKVVSKPSDVIKAFERTISLAGSFYDLTLITMKRSFLLVIDSVDERKITRPDRKQHAKNMSSERILESFLVGNPALRGLSLAIGGHSTCLIASEHSLASSSLAVRLSKSLNNNGPVYVANNMQPPNDTPDQFENVTGLHEKIFQFVRNNCSKPSDRDA